MIYVAHPYRNEAANRRSVENIIKEFVLRNPSETYISPIHAFGFLYQTVPYDQGMSYCLELLGRCDSAIFCEGWEDSVGCNMEMDYCVDNGIPYEFQKDLKEKWADEF